MKYLIALFLTTPVFAIMNPSLQVLKPIACSELLKAIETVRSQKAALTGDDELRRLFESLHNLDAHMAKTLEYLRERIVININTYADALTFVNVYLNYMNDIYFLPPEEQKARFQKTREFFFSGLLSIAWLPPALTELREPAQTSLRTFNTIATSTQLAERVAGFESEKWSVTDPEARHFAYLKKFSEPL